MNAHSGMTKGAVQLEQTNKYLAPRETGQHVYSLNQVGCEAILSLQASISDYILIIHTALLAKIAYNI